MIHVNLVLKSFELVCILSLPLIRIFSKIREIIIVVFKLMVNMILSRRIILIEKGWFSIKRTFMAIVLLWMMLKMLLRSHWLLIRLLSVVFVSRWGIFWPIVSFLLFWLIVTSIWREFSFWDFLELLLFANYAFLLFLQVQKICVRLHKFLIVENSVGKLLEEYVIW